MNFLGSFATSLFSFISSPLFFIYGVNTPSRWGTQAPFTNITLDWTCPEDLKEKSLMLWWIECWYYPKKFGELQKEISLWGGLYILYVANDFTAWFSDGNGNFFRAFHHYALKHRLTADRGFVNLIFAHIYPSFRPSQVYKQRSEFSLKYTNIL